jgi:hypothetical protein
MIQALRTEKRSGIAIDRLFREESYLSSLDRLSTK